MFGGLWEQLAAEQSVGIGVVYIQERKEDEKSVKNILDPAGVSLPGTWYGRDRTADPANGSVLYGNIILFRKEFREAPQLVYRNRSL